MIKHKLITEVKDRITIHPERHVILPRLTRAKYGTDEHEQWIVDNEWMVSYNVFMDDKKKAVELSLKLEKAFLGDRCDEVESIVNQLKALRAKPVNELQPVEYWTRSAYKIAEYAGGGYVRNAIKKQLNKYSGLILEAMCGHTTYFDDAPDREIICLDFCELSLERHPNPKRTRILCDLDQISQIEKLHFFKENMFDAICVCFGYKYPENIDLVVREFYRILKPGGFLSFIENPKHEYPQLRKRKFVPHEALSLVYSSGYSSVSVKTLCIESVEFNDESFFHIEGIK